jgi:transposase
LRLERQYKGDGIHGSVEQKGGIVTEYEWFVGIDWGSTQHDICVLDATGRPHGERTAPHTVDGLTAACQWLRELTGAAPDRIAVAAEIPRGLVVEAVLDQGFAVYAVNPQQLDRFRDRFTVAGAKDDSRDARVIADALRTDRRAFRRIQAEAPETILLRELVRLAADLDADLRRQANRLREQLTRVDAPWLAVCPAADEPWLWTLLSQAPQPERWARLTRGRLAALLRRHRIRRLTADQLVALSRRPRLQAAAGVPEAVASRIGALVPQLVLVHDQRRRTNRQIDHLLQQLSTPEATDSERSEHRDAAILQSVPGLGRLVTGTMLAEASDPLSAHDYDSLRALVGTAPVTKRSGKRLVVQMRYACNRRLRNAVFHWARTSIQIDPAARAYYDQLRARGHGFARAVRSVADRWLRILIALLKSRTLYDPSRFDPSATQAA